MTRIAISVEGQSEREFVNLTLSPYFQINFDIVLQPIIICTKRLCSGKKFLGGGVNIDRVCNEITNLLHSFDYVTTFYDFYGFPNPNNFNVNQLEKSIFTRINSEKLIPYIQKYEFETLLFCAPEIIANEVNNDNAKTEVEQIITSFNGNIEDINNSVDTAPSKRLIKLFNDYDEFYTKTYHGPLIIEEVGIDAIRNLCPRFNSWVEKLSAL